MGKYPHQPGRDGAQRQSVADGAMPLPWRQCVAEKTHERQSQSQVQDGRYRKADSDGQAATLHCYRFLDQDDRGCQIGKRKDVEQDHADERC
jgi:hypothetical protein